MTNRDALRTALLDLLDDTQHAKHDCGDVDCPVSRARAALATPSSERERLWESLEQIESDAGWLHDNVPDVSPDGVATLRDIARQIAKTAAHLRAALAAPAVER